MTQILKGKYRTPNGYRWPETVSGAAVMKAEAAHREIAARRRLRIHFIPAGKFGAELATTTTACGMIGYWEKSPSDEFSTAIGDRFEAVQEPRKVTCARCLRAVPHVD